MLHRLSQRQAPENLVSLIFEESQGNPFFVEEVYRHLMEEGKILDAAGDFQADIRIDEIEVPENVRLITNRRLERLSSDQRKVLEAAAVIGRSFSFQLLSDVAQTHVDQLFGVVERAQQMGIVVPSSQGPGTPFTFVHELVRQTLLAEISLPRRQRLHSIVAQALERLHGGAVNGSAGEIADHLLKAGPFADRPKVVLWLTQAARGAIEAAAYEEARSSLRSALSHLDAADLTARADLLSILAVAERGLGQWSAVLTVLGEALRIYIDLGDRELIGKAFNELADSFFWASRFQDAIETARRGLSYLKDVSADRARLLAILGNALTVEAGYEPAHEALGEALNIASQLSDPALEARLLGMRSMVNFHFFRLPEAAADGLRSEQLGGPQAPPWQRNIYLDVLHHTLLYLGRPEEAARIAELLEPSARKTGQSHLVGLCVSIRAWTEFGKAPDLAKLLTVMRQVSGTERKIRWSFSEALFEIQQGLGDFFAGNWADGLLHAQAACRFTSGPFVRGFGEGTLFLQMAYAGDQDGALRMLDEKRASLPVSGQDNRGGSWWMLALVTEGLVMLGRQSQAAQFYPLVRELVGIGVVTLWPMFRFTQTIAGIAAAAARQWVSADDHFSIALRQAESFPCILEQAEIRRFTAMMLLDRAAPGDRERARTLTSAALETYTGIGMSRHVELAQALLNQAAR
jgi:tetratricopeptide (TPR) repeat protein